MIDTTSFVSDEFITTLAANADAADTDTTWPLASWNAAKQAGVLEWAIPVAHGGREYDPVTLLAGYERIASACLTTAFILSQRDAAVRRIREFGHDEMQRELLRPLACGGRFATVGISQLTTSRQHTSPALRASTNSDGYVLNGEMPWVTGGDLADHLVAGAVLEDGLQVLLVVPTLSPGLCIDQPLSLAALSGSRTTAVRCTDVAVSKRWLLAGPVEKVMTGRGGTGGLETSCLALGVASAAIDWLLHEAARRSEWTSLAHRFAAAQLAARSELYRLVVGGGTPEESLTLRARANALALRSTQAALTASKGAGFVRPHPTQRWARQAMFFLVWSCPRPAVEATMEYLNPLQ
ncbi:MAG: acyl-CoA dehydrogenase family protein [Gemmataceae bacterium]